VSRMRGRIVCSIISLPLLASARVLAAEAPSLESLHPAGGTRGTTNIVTVGGKFDPWPPRVWISEGGVTFTAETNKGKFSVSIDADAAPGPRLVRLYNDDGASDLRTFVVTDQREILDVEPNNHFAKPQRVTDLPLTINGKLDKNGDVDSFAFQVRSGQWIDARVDCYTLMSKVDAVLRLMSTNGQQLAWNHDFTTLDPRLTWRATNDDTVVLQVFGFAYPPASEIALTGGDATSYRLHIAVSNAPPALCAQCTEKEPNNHADAVSMNELPFATFANIGSGEDEDRFRFTTETNKFIEARIEAASFGSPLDAWIKIEDLSGKQLARNDDADGARDPRLEWQAGRRDFVVAVGSLTHHGGSDFCYRLMVRQVEPDFQATLGASSLVLTPGATNELKIDVKKLRGFTNGLSVLFRDLPEGVTVVTTNLPKEGPIKLAAAADAPRFQGLVRAVLRDKVTGDEHDVPVELTTRGETPYTRLLVERCDQLWLTVRAKPVEKNKAAETKQP
jgi:hypothetical protein